MLPIRPTNLGMPLTLEDVLIPVGMSSVWAARALAEGQASPDQLEMLTRICNSFQQDFEDAYTSFQWADVQTEREATAVGYLQERADLLHNLLDTATERPCND